MTASGWMSASGWTVKAASGVTAAVVLGSCVALLAAVAVAQTVDRFSGRGPGGTGAFSVEGPWLLSWRVGSEFPMLAHLELHLYEEPSGRFVGLAVNHTGVGSGQKVIAEGGRYRIVVVGRSMDWAIVIEEARNEIAELLRDNPGLTRVQLVAPNVGLSPDIVAGIRAWQAEDESSLILRTEDGTRLRVRFYDNEPCPGLLDARNIFFVTAGMRSQIFNAILLEQGMRCYIGGISTIVE
jgi:hypothetical protein